jgi:hypothetical protein
MPLCLDHLNKKIKKRNEKTKLTNEKSTPNSGNIKKKEDSKTNIVSINTNGGISKNDNVNNGHRNSNIAILAKLGNNGVDKAMSGQDEEKFQIVNRLEEICKKYKTLMDPEDNADFENIVDTLKTNLSD